MLIGSVHTGNFAEASSGRCTLGTIKYEHKTHKAHPADLNALLIDRQRSCVGESLRIPLLQSEEQGFKRRAGYGNTAGVVFRTFDGGGLLAW